MLKTHRTANDALDPVCGIPEFKACAARVEAGRPASGRGAAYGFTRGEITSMEEARR